MPLDIYLCSDFEYVHERDQFSSLAELFRNKLGNPESPHCLIGNVLINGAELDAIYINEDYFHVIELKSHGGLIRFSENGPWLADGVVIKGGNQLNPFQQIRKNKFHLLHYLKENREVIFNGNEVPWNIIQARVMFGGEIELESRLPTLISQWLDISDERDVLSSIAALENACFSITDKLISRFIKVLGLSKAQVYEPGRVESELRPSEEQPPSSKVSLFFYKDFRFAELMGEISSRGGAAHKSAEKVKQILGAAQKGIDHFPKDKSLVNEEEAVRGALRYKISHLYQLLVFRHENVICPLCYGRKEDLDNWLLDHNGMMMTMSPEGEIIGTNIGGEKSSLDPIITSADDESIFSKVPELDLSKYIDQTLVLKALKKLSLKSENEDVEEVFDNIQDLPVRALLVDVYNFALRGELDKANARLKLFEGNSVPVSDVSGQFIKDKLGKEINTDRVVDAASIKPKELDQLLKGKFEDWMLYPHPDQKRYIDSDYDGSTILNGISGSGKTCILVHRAKRLAERYPNEKIGIVTLNRDLVVLIRNLINKLCSKEIAKRIEVKPFYDIFRDLAHHLDLETYVDQLRDRSYHPEQRNLKKALKLVNFKSVIREFDDVSKETAENTWDYFFDHPAHNNRIYITEAEKVLMSKWDGLDRSRYMREECDLIRSALTLSERNKYLEEFKRTGRTISLDPDERKKILEVLALYEEWMLVGSVIDVQELTQITNAVYQELDKLPQNIRYPFRCLLVDEYQDFSTLDLRVLGFIAPKKENGFFLTGDRVQKIQVKHLNLNAANLNVYPLRLRKNFRNSRQILKAASVLAKKYSTQANKSGEEIDYIDPELAARDTLPPQVIATDNALSKAWEITLDTIKSGADAWSVCIATCNPDIISIDRILGTCPGRLIAQKISGNCINAPERVVVSDLQGLKGFEFKHVIIVGCGDKEFPAQGVYREEEWRDALRLYVTLTRARDQVHLIHEGDPSDFILAMNTYVNVRKERATLKLPKPEPTAQNTIVLTQNQVKALVAYYNRSKEIQSAYSKPEHWFLFSKNILDIDINEAAKVTDSPAHKKYIEKLKIEITRLKSAELPALEMPYRKSDSKTAKKRGSKTAKRGKSKTAKRGKSKTSKKPGGLAEVDWGAIQKSGKRGQSKKRNKKKGVSVKTVRG